MKKIQQKNIQESTLEIAGISDLQNTIQTDAQLCSKDHCGCTLCRYPLKPPPQKYIIRDLTTNSSAWLHQLLDGLTPRGTKTLKINIPDICFPSDEGFIVYETHKKDFRLKKKPGTTPYKQLFSTLVQMKRQYKRIIQQNFDNHLYDQISPQFVHKNYINQVIPSHFHDGNNSTNLNSNKFKFKNYLLHDNDKYIIPAIEQHKMNDKQPFCVIKYNDNNSRLFNQKQIQVQCLSHSLSNDVAYIQSFIKMKQQVQSIFFFDYVQGSKDIDEKIFKQAELQVLIMLGGLTVYDEQYIALETLQQKTNKLMKKSPQQYIKLMTYKIVHYLAMGSRIYVAQMKLKWIANDIQLYFLQDVLSLKVLSKPKRHIRYFLPKIEQENNFYRDSRYFLAVYRDIKNAKERKFSKLSEYDPPQVQKSNPKHLKRLNKALHISKTISVDHNHKKRYKKLTLPKILTSRREQSKQEKYATFQHNKLNKSTRVSLQSQDFL